LDPAVINMGKQFQLQPHYYNLLWVINLLRIFSWTPSANYIRKLQH